MILADATRAGNNIFAHSKFYILTRILLCANFTPIATPMEATLAILIIHLSRSPAANDPDPPAVSVAQARRALGAIDQHIPHDLPADQQRRIWRQNADIVRAARRMRRSHQIDGDAA